MCRTGRTDQCFLRTVAEVEDYGCDLACVVGVVCEDKCSRLTSCRYIRCEYRNNSCREGNRHTAVCCRRATSFRQCHTVYRSRSRRIYLDAGSCSDHCPVLSPCVSVSCASTCTFRSQCCCVLRTDDLVSCQGSDGQRSRLADRCGHRDHTAVVIRNGYRVCSCSQVVCSLRCR